MSALPHAPLATVEERFAAALHARRATLDLSGAEMARRIGITPNMYYQRESGHRPWGTGLRSTTRLRLLEVTGWSATQLDRILDPAADLDLEAAAGPLPEATVQDNHRTEARKLLDGLPAHRVRAAHLLLRQLAHPTPPGPRR